MRVKDFIRELKNATIDDRIRKNIGSGYSVDTCVILYGIGFPNTTQLKNIQEWLGEVPLTVYEFTLWEALKIINQYLRISWLKNKLFNEKMPYYLKKINERLEEKLDRPEVRIVDDPRFKRRYFFKKLNSELYQNLSGESISETDKKLLLVSDYENNPIVSTDKNICTLACRNGIKYVETRTRTKLPLKLEISQQT
jgi:hypothetical protein